MTLESRTSLYAQPNLHWFDGHMIDSSGNRALRANGTILDMLPIGTSIGILGGLLVVLFTLIKPEASNGLDWLARAMFWALHVGMGLVAIWVASWCLANSKRLPNAAPLAILLTGLVGVVIAAPGYVALDYVYAPYVIDLDPDLPQGSRLMQIVNETLELAPWFMTAWLILNLPVLLPRPTMSVQLDDAVGYDSIRSESTGKNSTSIAFSEKPQKSIDQQVLDAPASKPSITHFLMSLPGVIGTDVVAVSSDLHYLNVWTIAGRTTVLGNLRDVVTELGDIGMQVHRSHWVAHAHVNRIVGGASSAACILSNELRIPISRRKWKTVRDYYGRGVVNRT